MPTFKMKTKSSGDFTRESNGLHVCKKSSKISKNSLTHTRNLQHKAELDTRTPNAQDADERTNCCQMVDGDNIQFQKHISPSSAMGHTETCSSTIETIFSPILDAIDTEPNIYDYGGKQWRESDLVLPSCGDDDVNDTLRMSCEYSDLFIPDMIVSSSRLLDYEYDESSRFFGDECLLLPFLEDNIQTENRFVDGSVYSEPVIVSEDSNLYVAIHQMTLGLVILYLKLLRNM
ncbi:hypothetical protein HanHA300_Chr12g0450041 [Helianthus annuus]|nr:hypothetical protein HanHA300_Chr12g0450041 [Helianthus annuus]KAJ0678836.1 hypothetical protein HanOQP8_Chr12g0452401 [Helianthus annuus]